MSGASMCSGAADAQAATETIWPTKGWQVSSPEEQGMDSKELAELVDFGGRRILATPGVTLNSMLDSLLVVRHGKIVVEAYYAHWEDDHTFLIDRLLLGLGQPAERWTLTFDGEKLKVRAKIGQRPEVSTDSEAGG